MDNSIDQLHKSRFGRVSSKRKFSDEYLTYENGTINVGQLEKKNKPISESTNNGTLKANSSTYIIDYEIGDIVWAKMGKFPVWPGIVTHDPDSNIYFKGDDDSLMFHLYFCNDMQKRSWIKKSQIFEFGGRKKILTKYPKLNSQIVRSKLKLKWNNAVDEAEYLATMSKEERITAFFVNNLLPKSNLGLTEKLKREDKVNPKPNSSSTKVVLSTRYTIKTSPKIEPKLENKYDHKNYIVKVNYEKEHPRVLIPELCKQFYSNGWVTGTGGGISIKYKDQIFIAPSGVQKERMEPEDLFVQDVNGEDVQCPPPEKQFTKSQCTPIFMCSYIERQAGAVIHTHSPDVVKLSLLNPENEVRISGLEMIKGIYNEEQGRFYNNDEDVIIPIIENSKFERDLVETFQQALKKYPATSAVLVRNHGMYVWGKDWKTAKTQCECYDYCFNILVFKKTNNI